MTEHEELQRIRRIVFNYTVPIKENSDSLDDKMGAGVLIDVGGKLLVVSAAHCIKDKPVVLESDFSIPTESRIRILRRGIHPTLDIGFMELERNEAIPILNSGECSLRMICLEPPPANGMFHIVGFPKDARKLDNKGLSVVKKGFGTQFLQSQGDHLFFSYPEKGWIWDDQESNWLQAPFDKTPHGYSGGGCWGFVQSRPSELLTPEKNIRLYADQIEWDKDAQPRHVKCVPIAFWLAVVSSCCPDLRPAIADRFPSL